MTIGGLVLLAAVSASADVPSPVEMGKSVAPLVESVKDAVVTIKSIKVVPRAVRGDPWSELLRERLGWGGPPRVREERQQGLGSGFIVDAKGIILTNNHVVAGADQIEVVTGDGRSHPASVVGSDPRTDVAVVRLRKPPRGLKVARLGDSDKVRVGDYVLAIGNPLGLGQTVTMGIVSAKNRSLDGRLIDYADFIQTDAAINQGNSGGPLFDFDGRVVGINSAILNPAMAMNVGFAIPINLAKGIADQLLESGKVGRGYLGVTSMPLTRDLARRLGISAQWGAVVTSILPKSPGGSAGLRVNDVVVEVSGRRVRSSQDLIRLVQSRKPSETVSLAVYRGNKRLVLTVKLGENPVLKQEDVLGMIVQRLAPHESSEIGIPEGSGLHVLGIKSRGLVSGSLQEGDIVVMIAAPRRQTATIESLKAFERLVEQGGHGQLVILRDGQPFALNF